MTQHNDTTTMNRLRTASRELHHSYAVNWTTAILVLGLALFNQLLGIAAKHEQQPGLVKIVVITQAAILLLWLVLCFKAVRYDGT